MTKTRRAGFSKKRRRGGRKTVKRRGGYVSHWAGDNWRKRINAKMLKRRGAHGGKRRSRVTKRGSRRRSRGTKRRRGGYTYFSSNPYAKYLIDKDE